MGFNTFDMISESIEKELNDKLNELKELVE